MKFPVLDVCYLIRVVGVLTIKFGYLRFRIEKYCLMIHGQTSGLFRALFRVLSTFSSLLRRNMVFRFASFIATRTKRDFLS